MIGQIMKICFVRLLLLFIEIIKPAYDQKKFKSITLKNGITALLVSGKKSF
jgi:secreted Zn-dependent insulinase-like peptidase